MFRSTTTIIAALSTIALTGPVAAAAVVGGAIDVPYNYKFARAHYWCSAGQAVIADGMPVGTMIYRTSPASRSAGEGMSFALKGNSSGPWNAMTANRAANMCSGGGGKTSEEPEIFDSIDF